MKLVNTLDYVTDWIGRLLGWLVLLMMLITCLVVVMRYLFQAGNLIFFQELVVYMHGATFMLASGWALKRGGHVRVDVFYRQFSVTQKAWIDSLGVIFFLLPVSVFLFFASLDFVDLSWANHETSGEAGGIAYVYLQKSLIPAMALLLGAQGLAELIRNGLLLAGANESPADAA